MQPPPNSALAEPIWCLRATGVDRSPFTGRGIRVAVLDTGLDLDHPDFLGRSMVTKSFIRNKPVQDLHGHGTHCCGTVCAPNADPKQPRYGIAPDVSLYVGKVLNDARSGSDASVLAGLAWALECGCDIISLSLGALVKEGEPHCEAFEALAQRALAQGTLIIAAAGSRSARPDLIRPVGHPANCPSILAVAALDENLEVHRRSNAGTNVPHGTISLAAPGVNVYSAWCMPEAYRTYEGSSMAVAIVAGIAALHAESDSALRGAALWKQLEQHARPLPFPVADVGAGLVQAPSSSISP